MLASVSLVVPTYNARDNIVPLLNRVAEAMRGGTSRYGSLTTTRLTAPAGPPRNTVTATTRRSTRSAAAASGAVIEGFRRTRGDRPAMMNAGPVARPTPPPALAHAVPAGADLAGGSRRVPGGGADGSQILLAIVARAEPLTRVELPDVVRDWRQGVSPVRLRVAREYLRSVGALRRVSRRAQG